MSADDARKIFVGGLPDTASEAGLRSVFEAAGLTVAHVAIPRDRESGAVRGFAFVTLGSEEQAEQAKRELSGTELEGRRLTMRAFDQEPRKGGAPRPKRGPEPTVFLGKLPFDATREEIAALFAERGVGPVERVTLPTGPDGRPRGFGFATLADDETAQRAVEAVDGAELRGRNIVVSPAQPRGASPMPGASRPRPAARYEERGPRAVRDDPLPPDTVDPLDFPMPPPLDEGRGRSRREGKKEKRDKKKGATRGARKRRGGGGNWHQWDPEDD